MSNMYSVRKILKINSTKIVNSNPKNNLKIDVDTLKEDNSIVGLASSYVIRSLDDIALTGYDESYVRQLKKEKSHLMFDVVNKANKEKMKIINKKIFDELFLPHIMCVHIDKTSHYDKLNKGFSVEVYDDLSNYGKVTYKRFLSTSSSIKKSEVFYVNELYIDELMKRVNNGRNEKEFVPAKLSAYMALTMSASNPVTNTPRVLVVDDVETTFRTSVIEMDGSKQEEPIMKVIEDYEMTLNASDGFGFINPDFANVWANDLHLDYTPSGFITRNAFMKGVLIQFPYIEFAEENNCSFIVKDVWGKEWDVRDVDIILTTSMLKLSNSYDSWEHYYNCCLENKYTFSVTKQTPKTLDIERTTNYQFIQSLELSDEDIYSFIKPALDEIKNIKGYDWRESLVYLRGMTLNESSNVIRDDYTTALMIEPRLINDSYVRQSINNMIKKRIEDCKKGTIKVRGNYQTITVDPVILAQSIFGMEVKGLLGANEYYSEFWNKLGVDHVVAMRAPQVSFNNISQFHLKNTNEMRKWYRYLDNMMIINGWDATCSRMSGMDCDGDTVFSTDNEYIKKGTMRETLPVVCLQNSTQKKICEEIDFINSDKILLSGNFDDVGKTTNRATSIENVKSRFEFGSKEWLELDYRVQACIQKSQDSIDVAKGIKIEYGFPKSWVNRKESEIKEYDTEDEIKIKKFNASIVADKKPYFFIYVYPHIKTEYNKLKQQENKRCLRKFGKTLEEVISNPETDEEFDTVTYYNMKKPVDESPSLMNKIAWIVENEFKNFKLPNIDNNEFKDILKSDKKYKKAHYQAILPLYDEYVRKMRNINLSSGISSGSYQEKSINQNEALNDLRDKALSICNNYEDLCNIMVDICYSSTKSKHLVWSLCGKQIIENLLNKNDRMVTYPVMSDDYDIIYKGIGFKMHTKTIFGGEDLYEV